MKKAKTLYLIFTSLFAALMIFTSIGDVTNNDEAIKFMNDHLQYPVYIIPFIGWAKILGVIAILIPGFPRIKEWAYAGLAFDLIGATYSVIAIDGLVIQESFMLLPFALGTASYIFYQKKLNNGKASSNYYGGH
ncbi:MAG: DoxX family protein [Bacteroidota bacterium]